jgi:metal-responsive CopG/Arc/MetJ family transcriptional regulator
LDNLPALEVSIRAGEGVRMATDKFEHATFYLTKNQVDQIKKLAKDNQISRSALVRMIIREYLARQDEHKKE